MLVNFILQSVSYLSVGRFIVHYSLHNLHSLYLGSDVVDLHAVLIGNHHVVCCSGVSSQDHPALIGEGNRELHIQRQWSRKIGDTLAHWCVLFLSKSAKNTFHTNDTQLGNKESRHHKVMSSEDCRSVVFGNCMKMFQHGSGYDDAKIVAIISNNNIKKNWRLCYKCDRPTHVIKNKTLSGEFRWILPPTKAFHFFTMILFKCQFVTITTHTNIVSFQPTELSLKGLHLLKQLFCIIILPWAMPINI